MYTGPDTKTTPEHSSSLTGITPCNHAERNKDIMKVKEKKILKSGCELCERLLRNDDAGASFQGISAKDGGFLLPYSYPEMF